MIDFTQKQQANDNLDGLVVGMNNEAMDELMLSLNNDIDSIMRILHQMDEKFSDIDEYFKGTVASEIQDKYKTYSKQYSRIRDNLNSYVHDLIRIKATVGKMDVRATLLSENQQEDAEKELRKAERAIDRIDIKNARTQAKMEETTKDYV